LPWQAGRDVVELVARATAANSRAYSQRAL